MDQRNLEAFLAAQQERGALDSSGGFTVNFSKAKLKLAKYQLEDPAGYLLKFVQAGVQLGARRILIQCLKAGVSITYLSTSEMLHPKQFIEMLQEPVESLGTLWEQTLATALRAAPTNILSLIDNEKGEQTRVSDKIEVTEAPIKALEGGGYTFAFSRPQKADSGQLGEESRTIWTRCQLCPVPVVFDGTTVNFRREKVPFYEDLLRESPFIAGEFHRVETERSGLGTPRNGRKPALVVTGPKRLQTQGGWDVAVALRDSERPKRRPHIARSLILLPAALSGGSRVTLVQYGVILETRNLALGCPGAEAALCVDGYATDLSGLKLRESDELKPEFDKLRQDTRQLVSRLKAEVDSLHSNQRNNTPSNAGATLFGTITGGLLGLFVAGPFGSLAGAWGGATLAHKAVTPNEPASLDRSNALDLFAARVRHV